MCLSAFTDEIKRKLYTCLRVQVLGFRPHNGEHQILYDDGDQEWIKLSTMQVTAAFIFSPLRIRGKLTQCHHANFI